MPPPISEAAVKNHMESVRSQTAMVAEDASAEEARRGDRRRALERRKGRLRLAWRRIRPAYRAGEDAGRGPPMHPADARAWIGSERDRCPDFEFWLEEVRSA